jgi:hypothetical protein
MQFSFYDNRKKIGYICLNSKLNGKSASASAFRPRPEGELR